MVALPLAACAPKSPMIVGVSSSLRSLPHESSPEAYPDGGLSLVSDGYSHRLVLERSSSLFYIIQVGGISGSQTVFGPFQADMGCLARPPVGQDWMSLDGRL